VSGEARVSPSAGKVLFIEDEAAIRDLLQLHLGVAGFEVKETGDGRTGLTMARGEHFDLIILDLMLRRWTRSTAFSLIEFCQQPAVLPASP
jgi:DNA-binding response OmpR family regulator